MDSISFSGINYGSQVGINNGEIHLPPERLETPPLPLSNVPFRRDPDFVDRGTLLDQIQDKGSTQGARIALVGLGGVGKSQLAIEYCHRVRDRSPDTWVFWIHASNATRFELSCREIADRVKVRGRQDPKENIYRLLHHWLNNVRNSDWVLVLDNLDDDGFLHAIPHSDVPERSAWSYLCQNSTGCVLMTSRSKQVALKMVEDYDIIPVEPMNESHATLLFEKKIGPGVLSDRSTLIQLASALEYMPLAIVQAAAFIKQRAPRESVTQYLEKFQKNDRQKINLLDYEAGQLRRDPEANNSILVTWQISFEDIRERRPSAADLLSLMSFFDRQGIPDSLLREDEAVKGSEKQDNASDTELDDQKSEPEFSEANNFEEDILLLRDYSLISVTSDPMYFEMHRLVQLATQKWLKAQDTFKFEYWKETFIRRLNKNFPEGTFEHWKECQLLFPHVQSTMIQQLEPLRDSSMEEWASLLDKAALFMLTKRNLVDCKKMGEKVIETWKYLLGAKSRKTLISSLILGAAYTLGGEWKKAEDLQLQVMETSKEVLGPEHPETLAAISSLASTYWHQGRWKEAEELQDKVLRLCSSILGPEHSFTLTSMVSLATTYRIHGRWKEAEELQDKGLRLCSSTLGPEHPFTLTNMSNLASIYRSQGRWKEARKLGIKVMERSKQVLGSEHPSTLASMDNLASTYSFQGQWRKAEELEVHVMQARKEVFGPEHPSTLIAMGNLAVTYLNQGRWKEAEELQVQAIDMGGILGPEHPSFLASLSNLASIYRSQGRWKEAEELQDKDLKICSKVLGPKHPSALISMGNLASIYDVQGRWKEAEELKIHVMEAYKELLGPDHPDTLVSISSLASTYHIQGRWKEAEKLQAKELKIFSSCKVLGPKSPSTLISMDNLASIYGGQGRWELEEAEEPGMQVMEAFKELLGPEHPDTLTNMSNLALVYCSQKRWKEAEGLGIHVMQARKKVFGPEHPDTLTSMSDLASTYLSQGRWEEAEELEIQVMELRKQLLGPQHPDTLTSLSNLVLTYENQKRLKEAEELGIQAMELSKQALGPDHPHTLTHMSNLAIILKSLDKNEAAVPMMARCAEARSRVLGLDHPSTLLSLSTWNEWYNSDETSPCKPVGSLSGRQVLLCLLIITLGLIVVWLKY